MPDFADAFDFMAKSTTLRRHSARRTLFDPTDASHLASMKSYIETGMWTVQFFCEDPFIDVPMTVFRKYIGHKLGVLVTTSQRIEAQHTAAQYRKMHAETMQQEESHETQGEEALARGATLG